MKTDTYVDVHIQHPHTFTWKHKYSINLNSQGPVYNSQDIIIYSMQMQYAKALWVASVS